MENWADAPPVNPYSHHLQFASYQHSLNPNPNPNPYVPIDPLKTRDQGLIPPGVDPGASASSVAHNHGGAYDPGVAYTHPQAAIDGSGYYQDPNAVNVLQNWAADVLRYYGSNPNATVSAFAFCCLVCELFEPVCSDFSAKQVAFKGIETGNTVVEMLFEFQSVNV